jgi:hypothetical protein
MARFTVQMTFETPGQLERFKSTQNLPGRAASIRLLGGDGSLAVTASRVMAESPAEAAMIVVQAVNARWSKRRGPLVMRSWRSHQERVLLGRRRSGSAWTGWWDSDEGEGGSAGVREPRRPLPGPGSLHAARDLPDC